MGPSEYLNQFLQLIAKLRGGGSRFLPLLMAKVTETMPSLAPPIVHSPQQRQQQLSSEAIGQSPGAASSHSAPVIGPSPINRTTILAGPPSAVSDPSGLVFSRMSPAGISPMGSVGVSYGPHDSFTPTGTPSDLASVGPPIVAAPVPRSVPRVQFDGYFG